MRILLTGGRAPATLDLARKLHRNKEIVILAESLPYSVTAFSTSIRKSYLVPRPRQEPLRFAYSILDIVRKEAIDLIIPTCEEIFTLVSYEKLLRPHVQIFAPEHKTLLRLHSKYRFVEWMNEIQLRVPKTKRYIRNPPLHEDVIQHGRRTVYKPEWSRFGTNVQIAPLKNDWVDASKCSPQYPWLAQEKIEGTQWCSYTWMREGKILLHTNYPMKCTQGTGASLLFSHQPHPAIEQWVKTFGEHSKYTGQIAFDFIDGDNLYAIECNPRMTSGIHCFGDFDIYSVLKGEGKALPSPDQAIAIKAALFLYANKEIKHIGFNEWFSSCIRTRDALFSMRDPLPGILWIVGYIVLAYRALRYRISIVEASTHDIEWNGKQ